MCRFDFIKILAFKRCVCNIVGTSFNYSKEELKCSKKQTKTAVERKRCGHGKAVETAVDRLEKRMKVQRFCMYIAPSVNSQPSAADGINVSADSQPHLAD